jgi:hypothetical protein
MAPRGTPRAFETAAKTVFGALISRAAFAPIASGRKIFLAGESG